MTGKKHSANAIDLKALVAEDRDPMKPLMKEALQEALEAEMTERRPAPMNAGRASGLPGRPS